MEWHQLFDRVNKNKAKLSAWEKGFMESLSARRRFDRELTAGQQEKLQQISDDRLGAEPADDSVEI